MLASHVGSVLDAAADVESVLDAAVAVLEAAADVGSVLDAPAAVLDAAAKRSISAVTRASLLTDARGAGRDRSNFARRRRRARLAAAPPCSY